MAYSSDRPNQKKTDATSALHTRLVVGPTVAVVALITAGASFGLFRVTGAGAADRQADPSATTSAIVRADSFDFKLATKDFPRNKSGQTYGSAADAETPEQVPELIGVIGDHQVAGFVLRDDYFPPPPQDPNDAAELASAAPRVLNVYDLEGKEKIDTFSMTPAFATTP